MQGSLNGRFNKEYCCRWGKMPLWRSPGSHRRLSEAETSVFRSQGSSKGQFYKEHLLPVRLNAIDVKWAQQNLSYLEPTAYRRRMQKQLAGNYCHIEHFS